MLRKFRGDAKWLKLSAMQRAELVTWLFEERLTYKEAFDRVHTAWGAPGSLSGLKRMGRYLCREREYQTQLEKCLRSAIASEAATDAAQAAHLVAPALPHSVCDLDKNAEPARVTAPPARITAPKPA